MMTIFTDNVNKTKAGRGRKLAEATMATLGVYEAQRQAEALERSTAHPAFVQGFVEAVRAAQS